MVLGPVSPVTELAGLPMNVVFEASPEPRPTQSIVPEPEPAIPTPPPVTEPPTAALPASAEAPPLEARSAPAVEPARPGHPDAAPALRPPLPVVDPTRRAPPGLSSLRPAASARPSPRISMSDAGQSARSSPPTPFPTLAAPASAPAAPAEVSAGWRNALAAWLQEHRSYPEDARRRAEEGTVFVRFTVGRDGQVLTVTLVRGSGSAVLDEAAQAMVRGGHLPAFTADMTQAQTTVTVPIRYRLER